MQKIFAGFSIAGSGKQKLKNNANSKTSKKQQHITCRRIKIYQIRLNHCRMTRNRKCGNEKYQQRIATYRKLNGEREKVWFLK